MVPHGPPDRELQKEPRPSLRLEAVVAEASTGHPTIGLSVITTAAADVP